MLHQPDLPSSPQVNPLLLNSIVDYFDDSEADDLDLPIIKPVVCRRSVAGCTNGVSLGDANPQIVSYDNSSSSVAGCTNGLSSGDANPQIVSYKDSSSSVAGCTNGVSSGDANPQIRNNFF